MRLFKLSMVARACCPSVWEVKVGESEIQGHLWLCSEQKVSLAYVRPCLKMEEKTREIIQ